jgi:hypothetical protein
MIQFDAYTLPAETRFYRWRNSFIVIHGRTSSDLH